MADRIVRALKLTTLFVAGAYCFSASLLPWTVHRGIFGTAAFILGFLFFLEVENGG